MAKSRKYYGLEKSDRLLALSGVPITYLTRKIAPNQIQFTTTSVQSKQGTFIINPQSQSNAFGDVLENIDALGGGGVYAVGSYPTDQPGNELATLITRDFFNHSYAQGEMAYVRWIDLGRPDWDFLKSGEECDLAVIHGMSDKTEDKKLEIAKDFIRRTENSTTLVLANTSNILKYAVEKLCTKPDIVWQLTKSFHHNLT